MALERIVLRLPQSAPPTPYGGPPAIAEYERAVSDAAAAARRLLERAAAAGHLTCIELLLGHALPAPPPPRCKLAERGARARARWSRRRS